MNKILNLTQHKATEDQIRAGVFDLPDDQHAKVRDLLTFHPTVDEDGVKHPPACEQIGDAAVALARLAETAHPNGDVMIGCAPWLLIELADELLACGLRVLFAFSERESVEQVQADFSVRKVQVFRHLGFIPAHDPYRDGHHYHPPCDVGPTCRAERG